VIPRGLVEKVLKIIHIITGLETGGAERALYNLLQGGLAECFESYVVSLGDEGTFGSRISALGVHVSTLGMRKGIPSLSGLLKLSCIIKKIQPDIIQGWMYHGNLAATLARNFAKGRPVVAWNIRQSLYGMRNEKPMTRQVIRANWFLSASPDVILYNSHLSRKQHEAFGFSSSSGRVIPNGIDVQRFCFSREARDRVRFELNISEKSLVVGHVARLHPMKDHLIFLRAAADLVLRYPETHYLLSGRNVSMDNDILEQLIPVQARDRFHLLGERDDVPQLMNAMDIFCLSSAWGEGFPNVLGEAMAIGVPCVATDVGDSALVVGDCGVVVAPRDKKALAAGIESLLSLSATERCLLGERAHSRIEDKFTLGEIVEQYATLYKTTMADKRKS